MPETTVEEDKVNCPVCGDSVLKRGLFLHIFRTNDPEGEGHYPIREVPPNLDISEIKVTGQDEVSMDYPDTLDLDDTHYLDTYTGKAYEGKRGLMIHLGQMAGQDNIPEDVTERHDAGDFPQVEIDEEGNISEVLEWPDADVPPLEPYLPWYSDEEDGYVPKKKIKEFVSKIKEDTTGVASAEAIERELL